MANSKIRDQAKSKNVYLWEIAIAMNVSEPTITRKLRTELSEEEASKFIHAIDEISKQKTEAMQMYQYKAD